LSNPFEWSNEEILDFVTSEFNESTLSRNTRIVGVYYEASVDVFRGPFLGAGGEAVHFVGVDLVTGERVTASYGGVSVSVGASLIPGTNFGGGAFRYTGEADTFGGWSIGAQGSAGVVSEGGSFNLADDEALFLKGTATSVGLNGALGYTFRVQVDGQVIYNFGEVEVFDYSFSGEQYHQALNSLINSPKGVVEIQYLHPDGYIITQTMQRVDAHPGYRVNVFESIAGTDGSPVSKEVASEYISLRVWRFEISQDEVRNIESFNECFGPEVPIDMWPLDPEFAPDRKNPYKQYDQDAVRIKIWKKPISDIRAGDWVVSFDKKGNLVPGYVPRTFQKDAKILLNFFGTEVTPGHVYYRPDSKLPAKFETLIDILRDDGVIQKQDGSFVRAATNVPIGDPLDGFVQAITGLRRPDGSLEITQRGRIRLGTRFIVPINDGYKDYSVADLIKAGGGVVDDDELIRVDDSDPMPFHWEFSKTLPEPEDFVLACSRTTLEDIYKAAEWESQGPRLAAPMVWDSGPVKPLKGVELSAMPRNVLLRSKPRTGVN
jgi:hypothetical protein